VLRRLVLVLTFLILSTSTLATPQRLDKILTNGEHFYLQNDPLAPYLESIKWEPPFEGYYISSNNWRGYIAKWEIISGNLVLVDVIVDLLFPWGEVEFSIIETIFPGKEQVIAEWYNDALIIVDDDFLREQDLSTGSLLHSEPELELDRYHVIPIKSGSVVNHFIMSHSEFFSYRDKKFEEFKKTELFNREFQKINENEPERSKEKILEFLKFHYIAYYLSL